MFDKQNPSIGSRPGTLAIPEGSLPPKVTVVQYDPAGVETRVLTDMNELRVLRESERVIWVDVQGFGDEATLRSIAEIFNLHPLALENAINVPQRAKSELYEHHQLIITRTPRLTDKNTLQTPQVCFIIGKRYLLTFQVEYYGFFDAVRERIQNGIGVVRTRGPDYLAYALIDAMIDRYYPVTEHLAESIEELEDIVVENPHPDVLKRIQSLRRQMVVLRRVGWPQREAINAMLREQTAFFGEQEKIFLRDTHDHIAQIVEVMDSAKEMASDLADTYMTNVSNRTNEIMKVLTLMASIFIPLTFVAGIYGMNFENMPELQSRNGYFVVWGVMVSLAVGMVGYFWRRGWIGSTPAPKSWSSKDEDKE